MSDLSYSEIERYKKDIGAYPRITREREVYLSSVIHNSPNPVEVEKAINEFVEANLRLVVKHALTVYNMYYKSFIGISLGDLISEGNSALIDSVKGYKAAKHASTPFSTYASINIRRRLSRKITTNGIIRNASRDKMVYIDAVESDLSTEELSYDADDGETDELINAIREALHVLTKEERHIINLRFFGGEKITFAEIAKKIGVSRQAIEQKTQKAIMKIKKALRDKEKKYEEAQRKRKESKRKSDKSGKSGKSRPTISGEQYGVPKSIKQEISA